MFFLAIKKLKTTIYYSLLATVISLPASLAGAAAAPGTAYFTLTPNAGTFNVGDYLTLKVAENSGDDQVNFVQANLSYDNNVLNFISIDASQSGLPSSIQDSVSPGRLNMARGLLSDNGSLATLTGEQTVALVTFKIVGAASGTSVSFDASSAIKGPKTDTEVGDYWNELTNGATFTFKAPSTPPASGGGGTSQPTSGSKTTTKATSSSKSTTTKPAVPGASSTPPASVTTVPVEASSEGSQVLTPTVHMVSIKVVDSKNKPVVGATVQFNGKTMHTISDGTVSFVDISDGDYTLSITHNGKTTKKTITVKGEGQPTSSVQNFSVKLSSSSGLPKWVTYTGIGLAILFIIAFFIPRGRPKIKSYVTTPASSAPVVVSSAAPAKPQPAPTPAPAPAPKPQPAPAPSADNSKKPTPVTPGTWFRPDNQSKDNKDSRA